MNGNMKFGSPVDGKKRKKYKSKLWSDIVDEYEEDMRKEKILQDKLLEKEMINKKEIVKKSLVDLNIPIETQTKESIPSVVKNNPECKTKQCENPVQPPKKSEKTLSDLWSEIVDEYEERIKSIPSHENTVEKDSSTSVDKCIKSDETVIRSKTSAPKMKINVEALRINPPETEKLSVEPTAIDKTKKKSKITKENQTEREYVTSSDKGEKSAKNPTVLKTLEKDTPEQSSAIVDLRVSDANNAIKKNKCKEKNLQKDPTNMSQKSENISLKSTELCENANALDSTTIQTSIPEMKTGIEGLKTNPHLKKDDKKETSKHEIDNKKLLVDSKQTEKNKKESIITQVSIERKKKSGVSNEQICKDMKSQKLGDITGVLNSPNIQTSTSTIEKSAKTVQIESPLKINDKKAGPIKETGVKNALVDSNIHIVKPKKELITKVESLLEKQSPTRVVQTKKSEKTIIPPKTSTLKTETSAEAVRIVTPVKEKNKIVVTKNQKIVKKTLEKLIISVDERKIKSTNTQEKSLKNNFISVDETNNSENTTLSPKNLEVYTSKKSNATVDIISPVDTNDAKNAIKLNKNQGSDAKMDKNTKIRKSGGMTDVLESPVTHLSTSTMGTSAETMQKVPSVIKVDAKDIPKNKIRIKSFVDSIIHIVKPEKDSMITQSSTSELQTVKPEETIICTKTFTSKIYPRDEAVSIVPSVNLDSMKEVAKHKESAEKPNVELSMPIATQKIISRNSQESSLKKYSSNTDAELKNAGKMVNALKELGKSRSTQSSDIYNNSSEKSAVAKNATNDNKNKEYEDKIERNSKIHKSGDLTVVLDSPTTHVSTSTIGTGDKTVQKVPPIIQNKAKKFAKNEIRAKTSIVDSIIHIIKPKKESIITQSTVVINSPINQLSTSTTRTNDEAVQVLPPVIQDETKEDPRNEIFKTTTSYEMLLEKVSPTSVDMPNNSVKTVKKIKSTFKENKITINDNEKDTNKVTRMSAKEHNEHTKLYDKSDIRNYFSVQTPPSRRQNFVDESCNNLCDKPVESSLAVHAHKENKTSVNDNKTDTNMQSQISGDLSVIVVTSMDRTNTKTTEISPETVQIVPSVKKDETKELCRNEIFAKIAAHKMSLENMSSSSVDNANNFVETNMKIEHSIKKNIIKEDDNTMTRKSSTMCIKYTKVCDKTADTTNYLSIQTPTRKTQKNVDELCHSPFDNSINGLDYVKNKKVPIKKLPVSTAEPFASVYKQNNGAITFLNKPLDDEYLVSPDFFKVFSLCFPSLSKKHQSLLPNQDLSKGKILAKQ